MVEAKQFLSSILPTLSPNGMFGPEEDYIFVALGGKYPVQRQCFSIDELVENARLASDTGLDSYMALAAFGALEATRKKSNAITVRSLWADIDVGKGGSPYGTQEEALLDLGRFVVATDIMPKYVVSSGKGLHVYWVFDRNITRAEYERIAKPFRQLCEKHGLAVDPARATDVSSVLRVPGTVHQKSGKPVTILSQQDKVYGYEDLYRRICEAEGGHAGAGTSGEVSQIPYDSVQSGRQTMPSLDGTGLAAQLGVGPQPPTADAELIAWGCKQVALMGFGSYPQWFAAMSVLRRCKDGLAWAHALSKQNPEKYDPRDTEKRFYEALPDNPSLCATFQSHNCSGCDGCYFNGKIKTPAQINIRVPQQVEKQIAAPVRSESSELVSVRFPDGREYPRIPIVSNRFKVDDRGIVCIEREKTDDGTWVTNEEVMCTSQLYYKYARLKYIDKRPQRQHIFEVVTQSGKSMEVWFDITQDYSKYAIRRWFANAGMYPTSSKYTESHLMSLMTQYLENVVNTAPEFDCYDKLGWYETQDTVTKEVVPHFVTGDGDISAKGMTHVTFSEGTQAIADKWYCHKGNLNKWKFVPQMYRVLDQPIGMLAMCLSFAAPLMKYGSGEAQNCILSLFSNKSGKGKTSMLRAAASIWGNPKEQFFTQLESVSARCRRLGIINNMPAFMDEITNATDEELADLSYTLIGGKEKHKLRSSGAEFVKTGEWSTCVFTTSNTSFKAALSKQYGVTDARLLRVMEYECDFKSYKRNKPVQEYINMCMAIRNENYGLAGPHFMMNLLQKPERLETATLKAENWSQKYGFRPEERFMSYPLALAMQAGRWAVEFGLLDYNMDALEEWCIKEFVRRNRAATEEYRTKTVNLLAEYLNSRLQNTLVITDFDRPKTMPDPGNAIAPDPYVIYRPTKEITVRIIRDRHVCFFARYDFIKWCEYNGYNYRTVIDDIQHSYNVPITRVRVDLGRNVSWLNTPRIYGYKIQGDGWLKLGYEIPDELNGASETEKAVQNGRTTNDDNTNETVFCGRERGAEKESRVP